MLGVVNLVESLGGYEKGIRLLLVIAMNECTRMENIVVLMNRRLQRVSSHLL